MPATYTALGNLKSKSTGPIITSVVAPVTKEYNLATGLPTGVQFPAVPVTWESSRLSSSIVYTTRRRGHPGKSNFCLHTRSKMDGPSTNSSTRQNWPSHNVYYMWEGFQESKGHDYHALAVAQAKTSFGVTLGKTLIDNNGQGYINEAVQKLRPDLTELSVPNFLIDIGQMKDLGKSLHDAWSTFNKIRGLVTPKFTSGGGTIANQILYRERQVKGVAKSVAGLNLAWSFGWKPTAGDLQAFAQATLGLTAKLEAFKNLLNAKLKSRYKNYSQSLIRTGTYTSGLDTTGWRAVLAQDVVSYIVYQPQPFAVMGEVELYLRAVLDSLGFELNPRIIWDAIPFSFVADWFVGVGNVLDRFHVDALELPVLYVDSYVQFKERIIVHSNPVIVAGGDQQPKNVYCGGWQTDETVFYRLPIVADPLTLQGLGFKTPSTKQIVLGLSLATVFGIK